MPNLITEEIELEKMKLISATDVARICTLSRSSLFKQEAAGTFPARVVLSKGRFAYPAEEVSIWLYEKYRLREKWFPEEPSNLASELDTLFAYTADPEAAAAKYASEMDAKIEKLEAEGGTK